MYHLRKRITTLLLCLCFLLELGPVSAFAAEEETSPAAETVRVLDCAFTPEEGEGCADYYIHVHTADCYDADGVLVCPLEERKLHKHDEACYQEEKTLVCGFADESDAHHHTDACYKTEKILVCEEQTELHTHSEDCYARDEAGNLTDKRICGLLQLEEHVHDDSCFRMELKESEEEGRQVLSEEEGQTGDALSGEESGEAGVDASAPSGSDGQTSPADPEKSDEITNSDSGNSDASDDGERPALSDDGKEAAAEDAGVTGGEADKQDRNPEQEENKEDKPVSETGETPGGEEKQENETEKPAADAGAADAAAAASDENEKKENADDSNGGSENDKQDSDGVSGEEEKKPEAEKEPAESEKQNDAPKPAEASDDKDAKGEEKSDTTGEAGKEEEKEAAEDNDSAVDPSSHPLTEVGPSEDEPLLAEENLSPATLALLGISAQQPKRRLMGARRDAMLADGDGETGSEDEGVSIEKIIVQWLSHSTGSEEAAGKGTLELETDSNKVGNQQFQIDFALSGTDDAEPGSIELVFPAWIWKDRYGNEPGNLTLSVPEEPETGADFSWRRVGDSIVITNVRKLSAAAKVMIQGTFRNVNPVNMVDIDVSDGSGEYPVSAYANDPYKGRSIPFTATLNVITPSGNVVSKTSNSIDATINTHVQAASATKSALNTSTREYYVYHSLEKARSSGGIPQEFLDLLGDEADQYSFARWYVSGSATGSQPFRMTVNDTFDGTVIHYKDALHQDSEELQAEGRILGVQGALVPNESGEFVTGNVVAPGDGQSVSAVLYNGYNTLPKSAYVWTAYRKSDFPTGVMSTGFRTTRPSRSPAGTT